MITRNVIVLLVAMCVLTTVGPVVTVRAETVLERKLDSLFMIASAGEVKFQDMVEPAKDSIAALGEDAVPFLIEQFDTKSAREKWTVIFILRKIGAPAVPYMVQALLHVDELIVQRICYSLGDIGDTAALEPLLGIVNHPRWQVREQAIGALGKIGDSRAIKAAVEGLDDQIGQVRKSAAVATGKLNIEEAIPLLIHRLGDDFYGARMSAVHSLLKMDSALTTSAVADSLDSPDHLIGDLGCYLLGQIASDEAIQLLLYQTRSQSAKRRAHAGVALVTADPLDNCGFHRFLTIDEPDRFVLLKINSALSSTGDVR